MHRNVVNFFVGLLLGSATLLLAGCYTVEGAGRDIAATGAGVSAGAESAREYSAEKPSSGTHDQPDRQYRR